MTSITYMGLDLQSSTLNQVVRPQICYPAVEPKPVSHPIKPLPITYSGISFADYGGYTPTVTWEGMVRRSFPWVINLYKPVLVRYFFAQAARNQNKSIVEISTQTQIPVQVVKNIFTYGYGWLPDMQKLAQALSIRATGYPRECVEKIIKNGRPSK